MLDRPCRGPRPNITAGPVDRHGLATISRRAQSNGRHQPELLGLEPEAEVAAQAFTAHGGDMSGE